ncbi:3-oxoacyl-(Acyl carrier protein) synthase II (fragment) [Methylocella tundrae]|uniref:3-oxoacyl-(Acyl carrier protein) synthase II n=1 Tax=Methylocella tundrae TaxID=227605 RepID=A0A4U8Z348_METTU
MAGAGALEPVDDARDGAERLNPFLINKLEPEPENRFPIFGPML